MKLTILVYICTASNPICDASTARVVQAYHAPEGIILCGAPAAVPIVQSAAGPDATEFIKVRCVLR